MTVGERIKKRRIELGLTQDELAERMGYKGKSSVSVAETRGDNVTTTKVKKFAKALDVSYNYLIGDYDEDESFANTERLTKALKMYEAYENSTPDNRTMVDLALKAAQRKP